MARPVGFADVVETVKPAVISVRTKKAGPQVSLNDDDLPFQLRPGSPLERFFRRFGSPDDMMPNRPRDRDGATPRTPRGGPRGFSSGQGSGFFISADGYAVTNNHVVEQADTVEIATDDGKTYTRQGRSAAISAPTSR